MCTKVSTSLVHRLVSFESLFVTTVKTASSIRRFVSGVLRQLNENMELEETTSSDLISSSEEQPCTLAHQMVHFFYHRQAIAKDAWDISFWQMFRVHYPDVELDAKALRSYFFQVVMGNASALQDLQYAVVQYINPLFNKIRKEVLESRDVVEGTDYVYEHDEKDASPVAVHNDELPPLRLQASSSQSLASSSRVTKRYITPSPEQIRNYVATELSEILWTEDEKLTKPTLDINECLLRVAFLTKKNIPLISCIEPGMACYDRLKQAGLIEVLPQNDSTTDDTQDSTPQLELAAAFSTPIAMGSRSKNYDSILKHVRSKPRRGVFKKHAT
ncbi:uncharacterized protein LOC128713177 [Anopheles marshallii]|uniref:uncharacterized protein LOC128713177 n=1 Tax=Anopheles marshallii TaxID=1521116 RepID=UPI00237B75C3|nr:uncharacterized protein LOC128713177 [Anopheles marshallii]